METAVSPRSHRHRLLFFLVLLCLPCSGNSLSNKDNTEYERKYDVIMSKLMHAAASLVNKDQLKALKNELLQMGEEADRQQVETLNRIEAVVMDFDEKMKEVNYSQKQAKRVKAETETFQKIMKKVEGLMKKIKGVLDKMGVSGAKQSIIYRAPSSSQGSIMTAATSSKRMKVLLFALITLTSAATTLIDDDNLKELKENIQTLKQENQRQRVSNMLDSVFIHDLFKDSGHLMDILPKLLPTTALPPLRDLIQETKFLMNELKTFAEQALKNEDAHIREEEEKLRQMKKLIMSLEKWRS
ncbi:hypothetical protein OJAV_G00183220 [Oryzias javanicus]|uniref:Uncharacterized protein n=1 Tax=Oryzias javanicus TaxID=123683 RepID=A0A437CCW8_ORYJA|nr:hypothetical protein OJAV_G00183220 [Oryzias javanicus]